MLYILLSICCSTSLIVIFKLFERYNINTFQAILFNYYTCVLCAWANMGTFPIPSDVIQKPWLIFALILGFCFITGFNAVGGTVRNFNMALASVMQKMSLLFAVAFTISYYRESFTFTKIFGILAAIGAILLTSFSSDQSNNEKEQQQHSLKHWLMFPIAAWVLSGVIDILLYYVELEINKGNTNISFIATLFGTAGLFGTLFFIYGIAKGSIQPAFKNVLGGIVLGVPNFYSIYFLLKSFSQGYEGSKVFPLTNVGIILSATFVGYLFFKEPMQKTKIIGIGLAVLAIILIAM